MKIVFPRCFQALLILLALISISSGQDTQLRQDYSAEDINADLDRMQEILETMHPGLYLYITPEELKQEFAEARLATGETKSMRQAFLSLAAIVDKVRCGHTYASVPNSAQEELTRDAVFFPLPLKFLAGQAFVNHKNAELPCGAEVLSINGLAMPKLIPQLMPFVTGDGYVETYRYELLSDLFGMSLAVAFPQRGQFDVEYRKANGEVAMKTVQAINSFKLQLRMKSVAYGKPPRLPYRIDRVSKETFLIAIDTFDNDYGAPPFRMYRQFIQRAFKMLGKTPEVKNLILDLRLNEGGYTRNEMMLYSFLSERPFREMHHGGATQNSIAFKENLSRLYQSRGMIRGYERRLSRELEPVGEGAGFELSEDWNPRVFPDEDRFEGNIYVLTSGRTHSAASAICSRLQATQSAVFIGEETGGVNGVFTAGTTLVYALPNTGIELAVPILKYSNLEKLPAESGRGIKPDHTVTIRPVDIQSGEDRVLKFAIELVRRHSRED